MISNNIYFTSISPEEMSNQEEDNDSINEQLKFYQGQIPKQQKRDSEYDKMKHKFPLQSQYRSSQQPSDNRNRTHAPRLNNIQKSCQGQFNMTKSSNAKSVRNTNKTMPKWIGSCHNVIEITNPSRKTKKIESDYWDPQNQQKNFYNKNDSKEKKLQTYKNITRNVHKTINNQYVQFKIQKYKQNNIERSQRQVKRQLPAIYGNEDSCEKAAEKLGFICKLNDKGEKEYIIEQDEEKAQFRQRMSNHFSNRKFRDQIIFGGTKRFTKQSILFNLHLIPKLAVDPSLFTQNVSLRTMRFYQSKDENEE